MNVVATVLAAAALGIDVFLIVAGLRLERRIRRLEDYYDRRHQLAFSTDKFRKAFEEMRKQGPE